VLPSLAAWIFFGCACCTAGVASADVLPIEVESDRVDDVREGHVTLRWKRLESVVGYEVIDSEGRVVYQGVAGEAFLSGLPDGEHPFRIRGIDADGQVIAEATTPILVVVKHWPLSQAIVLFLIGLFVVVAMMAVILRGAADPSPGIRAEDTRLRPEEA